MLLASLPPWLAPSVPLGGGEVTGGVDEEPELFDGDLGAIDPERVQADRVPGSLVPEEVERERTIAETAG
jgi:hypothetical protein